MVCPRNPPPPPIANDIEKRNINQRLKWPSGTTSATPFWSGKISSHSPSRNIQVATLKMGLLFMIIFVISTQLYAAVFHSKQGKHRKGVCLYFETTYSGIVQKNYKRDQCMVILYHGKFYHLNFPRWADQFRHGNRISGHISINCNRSSLASII